MRITNKRRDYGVGLTLWLGLLIAIYALSGCGDRDVSVEGFVLPDGDAAAGEATFSDYGCNICHVVAGSDIAHLGDETAPRIQLGGVVRQVRSYGELLTSIVNPDHTLSSQFLKSLPREERDSVSSPMPDFNKKLTVVDLIDLVEFLHSSYEETVPEYVGRKYVR